MNIAYVAGLVDGEGCLGLTKCGKSIAPRIVITNTNKQIIYDLKEAFGGHILYRPASKQGWKCPCHWVIQNSSAIEFLEKIYKYLRIKKDQATCLFLYEVIRPGKGNVWTKEGKDSAKLISDQIHWLNRKGDGIYPEPMKLVYEEYLSNKKD